MNSKPKVVISSSAKLQKELARWRKYWEAKGYEVLDWPRPIADDDFKKLYRQNRTEFFDNIRKTDVLSVMNEDKDGVEGYIGPSTFAEMAYTITENHLNGNTIKIVLLKMPAESSPFFEDVARWKEFGWVAIKEQ